MTEEQKRSLLIAWYNLDRDLQNHMIRHYLQQYGNPHGPESWFEFLHEFSANQKAEIGKKRPIDTRSIN